MANQDTKRRILVVDDQPDITITLKIGLEEDSGFDVDAFTDPELALSSFLRNSKYVLAIVWLLVLLVASASCSFQRVSATTERESWLNWTRSEKFVSHDPYEPEDQDRHRDAVLKEIDSEVSRR